MPDSVGIRPGFANLSSLEPSGLDIVITITKFPTAGASEKTEHQLPLRAILGVLRDTRAATKATLPWLKLASFGDVRTDRGSLRSDRNLTAIHGVEGDYDGEQITLERARQIIQQAGIAAVLYTSPSHTPQAPRWRVLCPTSAPMPPGDRARLLARLNGLFVGALSNESFTLSQSYYYGAVGTAEHHTVIAIDGRPIDQADELDATAIGKPAPPKVDSGPQHHTPLQRDGEASPYARKALESECQAIVYAPDGGKHHALNKAAYSIGGLVAAGEIEEGFALAALRDALGAIRGRCEDFAHAEKTLATAFADGVKAPRRKPEGTYQPKAIGMFGLPVDGGEATQEGETSGEKGENKGEKPSVLWVDAGEWDPALIPKRPWSVPGYLMRGSVSVLSGQGAGGKSSLVVAWTISAATGVAVGEFKPPVPLICVNYNTEDDQDEQRRRYSAALNQVGKTPQDIARRVMRCGPSTIGTLFERDPTTGRVMPTQAMVALESLCEQAGADVLICDPLAELHNAEENDNTAMRAVIAAFRGLAQRLNISVMILHHDRKGTNAPGDMDRMRGASAITGAVRVMLTLTTMSQEEADKFGIPPEDRRRHFRVDGAKSNYAIASDAEWWKLTGYDIPNGETVAAAMPWQAPSLFGSLPMGVIVQALDSLAAGRPNGDLWSPRKEARDGWGGRVLADIAAVTDSQASEIIKQWLKSGILKIEKFRNSNRMERDGLTVDRTKLSEMRQQTKGSNGHDDA